jgi:hypothetical protein
VGVSRNVNQNVEGSYGTGTRNLNQIAGIATGLVAVNILLMLVLSYTPVADIGLLLFSNYFVGIATFVATVGGGFWISNTGIERGNMGISGVGVTLIQVGYALLGSAILVVAPTGIRVPAIGISTVLTAALTAAVAVGVFKTSRSFERFQFYSRGVFVGGFVVGAIGFFVTPALMLLAGVLFFLGFVLDLIYEIWAVRENKYASTLRNAIGIYVAVMGVFIHILQLVLRVLSVLDN